MAAVPPFSVSYRVRFDEATPEGALRTSGYLRYMQDVASQHSASVGFDLGWYAAHGRFWLVRYLELDLRVPVGHGEVLDVSTEVLAFRRVRARRMSEFRRPSGELVASAIIDWVMTTAEGAPTRVPAAILDAFVTPPGPAVSLGRVELSPVPAGAAITNSRVRLRELDPMNHVNNATYVDYLEEDVVAAGGHEAIVAWPRGYRLEYLSAASPAAELIGRSWRDERGWAYRLVDGAAAQLLRARIDMST